MIRRAFWLGAGATAGILGYRRAAALGRRLFGPGSGTVPGPRKDPHAVRDMITFARDVREGMDIYTSRHALPSGSSSSRSLHKIHDRKDGR
jgi:hypothetical protein